MTVVTPLPADARGMEALFHYPAPLAFVGEGARWNGGDYRLYWLDADKKKLFALDPMTNDITERALPRSPGSFAFTNAGAMLMAYRTSIELEGGRQAATEQLDFGRERFNDGACDRAGRYWIGTMDKHFREPVGSLFRLDRDLALTRMASGLTASNGIAFSLDDRVMYHTDTRPGLVYAYDFDLAAGAISNRRVFAEFDGPGRPDGCVLDAEGCLWVAEIGGGRVSRFDPSGRRIAGIELPVSRPTSVAFGGADLRTLYITTMQYGLTDEERRAQPLAGALLFLDVGVRGLAPMVFALEA